MDVPLPSIQNYSVQMYNSWSSINGQASSSYADYFDDQRNVGSRGNANSHVLRSQPSHPYVSNATQTIPIQPQVSGHQIHLGSDPHLIVKQTDQTLNALAFARRLSTEYIMDFYDKLRKGQYYESYEGSSEPSDGLRPPQAPAVTVARQTPKGADGHACSYCGKAFSRPSALKIHLAIHTGKRAYTCPEAGCHRKFSVRSNMSRHIRNVHQIWPEVSHVDMDSGDSEDDKTAT